MIVLLEKIQLDLDWDRYRILGEQAEASLNYAYAEAMWAMAVLIAQRFGERDRRTSYSLDGLSRCLIRQQKYDLAEHFLRKVWTIRTHVVGSDKLEIATTMNLVAEFFYYQGKFADAMVMSKNVFRIYQHVYGPNHSETKQIVSNLSMLEGLCVSASSVPYVQAANRELRTQQTPRRLPLQNPAPRPSNQSITAHCEGCGSVMKGDWCVRCTGHSVKAFDPGQKLT